MQGKRSGQRGEEQGPDAVCECGECSAKRTGTRLSLILIHNLEGDGGHADFFIFRAESVPHRHVLEESPDIHPHDTNCQIE